LPLLGSCSVCLRSNLARDSSAQTPPTQQTAAQADKVELLFVQNSTSGSYDGKTLTLKGVGPTIYFSDRPQRITGQVRTAEFIGHWDKGSDNLVGNPPNATLSILSEKDINSVVVELTGPNLKANTLSYQVKVLRGKLPASFKESSLFIDILGRWRMAAMGMAVGEARGEAKANQSTTYYHPAPAPAPAPAAPVYTAPPPPAANVTVTPPPTVTQSQAAAVAKLKELKSLLNQGLISQSQYQADSQKLLNEIVQ
jgi:hypothetical protein